MSKYQWTDDMGNANVNPALEDRYRAAVVAACDYLEQYTSSNPSSDLLPKFVYGRGISAKDEAATKMVEAVRAVIADMPEGSAKQDVISFAVRAANLVRVNGWGEKGWAALAGSLRPVRRPLPA